MTDALFEAYCAFHFGEVTDDQMTLIEYHLPSENGGFTPEQSANWEALKQEHEAPEVKSPRHQDAEVWTTKAISAPSRWVELRSGASLLIILTLAGGLGFCLLCVILGAIFPPAVHFVVVLCEYAVAYGVVLLTWRAVCRIFDSFRDLLAAPREG